MARFSYSSEIPAEAGRLATYLDHSAAEGRLQAGLPQPLRRLLDQGGLSCRMESIGFERSRLTETLESGSVRTDRLRALFRSRHLRLAATLEGTRILAGRPPLRVAVSGAGGLLGTALCQVLELAGQEVLRLTRGPAHAPGERSWDPARGILDPAGLEGLDAVVHLAGEKIGAARWTASRKRLLRESRLASSELLVRTLVTLKAPPKVLLSASAVGYYGDRGDEELRETSPPGDDFLARLAVDWEAASEGARAAGIRVVPLRMGMVLSSSGGALASLLPIFRMGAGGPLGRGTQYMSWIALDDLIAVMLRVLCDESLAGPINAVSPRPSSNRDFSRALGRVLGRPALTPLPGILLRVVLGERAGPLLLSSACVRPARLEAAGFTFRYPELQRALEAELMAWPHPLPGELLTGT